MGNMLLVMMGGAIGAGLRHTLASALLGRWPGPFPWPVMAINVSGCLLMGMLLAWLMPASGEAVGASDRIRLLLGTGLLGGFTTYSTFAADFWMLAQRGLMGQALLYAGGTLAGSLLAFAIGWAVYRGLA